MYTIDFILIQPDDLYSTIAWLWPMSKALYVEHSYEIWNKCVLSFNVNSSKKVVVATEFGSAFQRSDI